MNPFRMLSNCIVLLLAVAIRAQEEQVGPRLCNDEVTTGYNNSADLRADLQIKYGMREFTLCPSTVFDLSLEPLVISHSVILRCGDATAASEEINTNCILEGGENQITIEGDISIIELYGLSFQTSTHMSVQVKTTDSVISFTNCRWRYHEGHSVVFIGESPTLVSNSTNITVDEQLNITNSGGLASTILENSTDQNFDDTPGMPTDPLPNNGTGDVNDVVVPIDPVMIVDNSEGARAVSARKRSHGGHYRRHLQVSSITTSVTFQECEFMENTAMESLIIISGGFVSLTNSRFISNNAEMNPLILSLAGEVSVTDTVFLDNTEPSPTHVFIANEAVLIFNTGNCGNEAFNCSGIFEQALSSVDSGVNDTTCVFAECTGECTAFDMCMEVNSTDTLVNETSPSLSPFMSLGPSTPVVLSSVECPSNTTLVGYVDMSSLQLDLMQGVVNFQLCPGSNITGSLELLVNNEMIIIECMDTTCVWVANQFHVKLEGEGFGFQASGITFRGATVNSIIFVYENATESDFLFEDCVWEDNAGPGVFVINPGSALGPARKSNRILSVGLVRKREMKKISRRIQTGRNDIKKCVFQNNVVEEVVFVNDSSISLQSCTFRNNVATGSMITAFGSSITIKSNSFEGNFFSASQGLIHLGENSVLDDESVCASGNTPVTDGDSVCFGIWMGDEDCGELVECVAECYSSWSNLVEGAEKFTDLVVCPNTTLEISDDSPLILAMEGTILKCGPDGLRRDNCMLTGGSDQLVLAASGIAVIGLKIVGSSRSSVRGEAGFNTTARFLDCEFSYHTGLAVLFNHGGGESFLSDIEDDNLSLSEISDPQEQAMSIEVVQCLVSNNTVALAPFMTVEGSLLISNTVFIENEGGIGTIGALFQGDLHILSSCFIGNAGTSTTSSIASTAFVDDTSNLINSDTNFGLGNMVTSNNCTNGVMLASSTCVPFTARFCESSIDVDSSGIFKKFSSCVYNFETLLTLVSDKNTIEIEICPQTTFDQDIITSVDTFPLAIDRSDISISCGNDGSRLNDCHFVGGDRQLEIVGNVTNVVIRGVTFSSSTQVAVMIEGSSPLSVDFVDCLWELSTGESAVIMSSLDPATESPTGAPTKEQDSDDVFQGDGVNLGRHLQQVGFEVALQGCSFKDNAVTSSLVVNKGGELHTTSCTFSSNTVGESLIFIESGRVFLETSCFDENDSTAGVITTDESSFVESESNFFADGSSVDDGFNSTFCQAPLGGRNCFDSWKSLSNAVDVANSLGQGSVFTICQDSVLEVDDYTTIALEVSGTLVQCGEKGALENRCKITGGQVQFHVSADDVTFRGINLLNSSIAAIHTSGDNSGVAYLDSCVLSGHFGVAAMIGYNGDIRTPSAGQRRRVQALTFPESDPTMALDIRDSYFLDNAVELAPLSVLGGKMLLGATAFTGNSGFSTGVGIWYGGELEMSPSCFDDQGTDPSIFVDSGSTIMNLDSNTSEDSTAGDTCTEILSGSDCFPIPAQNCNSTEVVPLPLDGCYDGWVDLGLAITSSLTEERDQISFIICEGALLNVNDDVSGEVTPIVVSGVEVSIKCGEEGSRDGNCIINGGHSHFKLEGSGTTNFHGIIFEAATVASILATGESAGVATFTECTWRQNEGQTTLLMSSQAGSGTDLSIDDLVELGNAQGAAMTVLADKCIFENNDVGFGVIANVGGNLNLLETVMVNNRDSRFGVVAGVNSASVGLSFTCFTGNTAIERGVVFIDNNSTLAFNRNSYGSDNNVGGDECASIFLETVGSCAKLGTCEGSCTAYESNTCRVTSFTFDSTVEPTSSPTMFPSSVAPTAQESDIDGGSGEKPSDSGGSKAGSLVAAIIVPLFLIGLGAGYVVYSRRKANNAAGEDGDEGKDDFRGEIPGTIGGDESQSRSKTQEMDDDDHSDLEDVDINDPLAPLNPDPDELPQLDKADVVDEDETPEDFEDEEVIVDTVGQLETPLKKKGVFGGMLKRVRSSASKSSSEGGDSIDDKPSAHQTDFIRIPQNMKTQLSKDILSFRDLPTTF